MKTLATLYQIPWAEIESGLDNLTPVDGGFSQAHRGLLNLSDGGQVFVKVGVDANSNLWARKEVALYEYLKLQSYSAAPELLSSNADHTSFALEALTTEDGWDWTDTWTSERLAKTLQAMDELAKLKPVNETWMTMGQVALDESRDGWATLQSSDELQTRLLNKLHAADHDELADSLDISAEVRRSSKFEFRTDTLVHYDVRADNCAWNAAKNQVKLVDWNWAQYGDPRVDSSALLTQVQKSGLDISKTQASRLDADALQWLAGFWFNAAATPIWEGGPEHLRDFQLESGVTAYKLMAGL